MATVISATILAVLCVTVLAIPEQGKWIFHLDQDHLFAAVSKHMYKGSKVLVTMQLTCDDPKPDSIEVSWLLQMSPCAMDFIYTTSEINTNNASKTVYIESYMEKPLKQKEENRVEWLNNRSSHHCSDQKIQIEGDLTQNHHTYVTHMIPEPKYGATIKSPDDTASHTISRKKREESADTPAAVTKVDHPPVALTWVDGNYLFVVHVHSIPDGKKFSAEVTIRTYFGEENYISAMDYPLLIFYGLMGLIYISYGLVWLVLLACNWRDLLRVQFWIGGVILLGMLEKAAFFAEYENINKTGQSEQGVVIFAELVSCLRKALTRMLFIIISLGFDIVRFRLGQTFHKVLFVGGLYFILASIEGCMRALAPKAEQSNKFLLAAVPLALLEAIIWGWIVKRLRGTTRALQKTYESVKLTLYRHFTAILIFAVLASIACMVWSMLQHRFKVCIEDWKQLWIDEAFWHMLFVVLLFIIMLLWRPTANNLRCLKLTPLRT